MKSAIPFLLILLAFSKTYCQDDSTLVQESEKSRLRFEVGLLPLLVYNSIDLGISLKHNEKIESKLNIGALKYWDYYYDHQNIKITYNLNFFLLERNLYIPLWLRAKNDWGHSSESEYSPTFLRYSIGSGFGKIFKLNKKLSLRTEFGLGYSYRTASGGEVFNYRDYEFAGYEHNSIIEYGIAARLKVNVIF